MLKCTVSFDESKNARARRSRFKKSCESPKYVSKCLERLQRWRKGIGEYEWTYDPSKEKPMPFSGEATSILIDSAIRIIKESESTCLKQTRKDYNHEHGRSFGQD